MSDTKDKTRLCNVCGRPFMAYKNGAGYKYCCVACGEKAHKEQARAAAAPQRAAAAERKAQRAAAKAAGTYEKRTYNKKSKKPLSNMDEINRINNEALAHGMSYGKYVLMLEMQKQAEESRHKKATHSKTVNGVIVPERILNAKIETR